MQAEPETSYVCRPILAQRGFKHPKAELQFLLVCVQTTHRETVHMHEKNVPAFHCEGHCNFSTCPVPFVFTVNDAMQGEVRFRG